MDSLASTPTPMTDATDTELLRAWQAGDQAAGKAIFDRHSTAIARFFHNKVPSFELTDLIHDTFLACFRTPERFRGDSSFRVYLFGIATNVWRNHCRKQQGPRNHAALSSTSMADEGRSPSELMADCEEQRMLLTALRRLDMDSQLLLELHYWERLSQREMGEVLEVPDSTIKNRLGKARRLLTKALAEVATSPQMLESTLTNLDDWAEQLRRKLPERAPKPNPPRKLRGH
jgi:RNA polymerase sigma factor (sigma-70 family)